MRARAILMNYRIFWLLGCTPQDGPIRSQNLIIINQSRPDIERSLAAWVNVAAKALIAASIDIATIISFRLLSKLVMLDQWTGGLDHWRKTEQCRYYYWKKNDDERQFFCSFFHFNPPYRIAFMQLCKLEWNLNHEDLSFEPLQCKHIQHNVWFTAANSSLHY